MSSIGFESIYFTVAGEEEEYAVNKEKGGAINAKITGLGSTNNTLFASDVPFFVSGKGVSSPKVELEIADLLDGGLYNALLGIQEVEGASVIGSETAAPYTSMVAVSHTKEGTPLYLGMTKGKFAAPDMELGTAEDKGQELKTDSISGDFIADGRGYVFFSAVGNETMTLEKFKGLVNNEKKA